MKAFIGGEWKFATKDLAIICANEPEPNEINVDSETNLVSGLIDIDFDEYKNGILSYQLNVILKDRALDPSDICDYIPLINCSSRIKHGIQLVVCDRDSLETKNCNYSYDDLSAELRAEIEAKADEFFMEKIGLYEDYAEHYQTDFNED